MRYCEDDYEDHRDYGYEDSIPKGYCSACHEECVGVQVDYGIGPYEYWGHKSVDVDLHWVSLCCEEEILDNDPKLYEED